MFRKNFLLLFSFYISYAWFGSFSGSVLPTHFLKSHITLQQMMAGILLGFIGQLILLLTLTKFRSKISWRLAVICTASYLLLVASIHNVYQFYLGSIIGGFALYFFYIFYNVAHFENTPKEHRGSSSAIMFVAPGVISIIAPLLAGFLAQTNVLILAVISITSFFITLFIVNFQKDFEISYTVKNAFKEIKSTRIFIFVEGIWEAMIMGIIPIYTLFFIKTPLNYGAFLSYLAVVSIVANLTIGKISDKLQKRIVFLYPITILLAITTLLFTQVKGNLSTWIILAGLIQFLLPLFWNVSTAMVVDAHSNLRVAIPGREIMLAAGRITGLTLAFLSFTFEKTPYYIFIVLGLIFLLYPALLLYRTKISKSHSFL